MIERSEAKILIFPPAAPLALRQWRQLGGSSLLPPGASVSARRLSVRRTWSVDCSPTCPSEPSAIPAAPVETAQGRARPVRSAALPVKSVGCAAECRSRRAGPERRLSEGANRGCRGESARVRASEYPKLFMKLCPHSRPVKEKVV